MQAIRIYTNHRRGYLPVFSLENIGYFARHKTDISAKTSNISSK
jgi:hypothetical protein